MKSTRHILLDWAEQGKIAPEHMPQALSLTGVFPTGPDWRRFLDHLLLWLGTLLVGAGVIFFFAYNWQDLGRLAKFGLVEGVLLVTLIVVWRFGLETLAGKAALLAASLFVGALLALVGQTYQTGADTFELFAAWAMLILPWVLLARFAALWVMWLLLLNVAAILYYQTFGGLFDLLFGTDQLIWVLFGIDTVALIVWESLVANGIMWLRERWAPRLLATASGGFITALAVYAVLGSYGNNGVALLVWAAWLAIAYWVYRHQAADVYVLAGGVLSVIVIVTAFLGKLMLDSRAEAGGLLFIGLIVIGLSAAGGWWLKRMTNEVKSS